MLASIFGALMMPYNGSQETLGPGTEGCLLSTRIISLPAWDSLMMDRFTGGSALVTE